MSLFDLNDPQSVGLLSLGLRLMSTPGGLGQALGQSGLGAMGDVRATQQASQQQQMAKLAFERAQMERDQAAEAQRRQKLIEQAAIFATRSPQQQALAGGGGPTVENAAKIDPNGYPQMDPQAFVGQLFKQGLPMEAVDYQGKLKKQEADPIKLGANERLLDPKTKGVLVDAMPDAGKKSALAQMIAERDSLPVGSPMRAVYDAAIQKQTTHAPAATAISYGAPVVGVNPKTGEPELYRPDNKGGMSETGIKPPAGASKDLTEAQAKATAFLGQMRSASSELNKLGADQTAMSTQAETALAGGPMNVVIGQKAQRIRQSQDQWSEAFLRFKTGAASTKDEVTANRRTFFPVIGDKPEQVALKKRMREQAERDMEVAAGRGAGQLNSRGAEAPADNDPLGLRK